jgi:hypothetical protein
VQNPCEFWKSPDVSAEIGSFVNGMCSCEVALCAIYSAMDAQESMPAGRTLSMKATKLAGVGTSQP